MSIAELTRGIKHVIDRAARVWGIPIIVILVAMSAFGLGRLSATLIPTSEITVAHAPDIMSPQGIFIGGQVIASRITKTYYFPWCASAQKIATANEIWFSSEDEARNKGYIPAKNCRGMQ